MLNRYIFRRMAATFGFGLALFVTLVLSAEMVGGVGQLLAGTGQPVHGLVEWLWGRLPSLLVLAFPMSALLACNLVFSRLQADGEWVALQASGASARRVMRPALWFCGLCGLAALAIGELWAPMGARLADQAAQHVAVGFSGGFLIGPQMSAQGEVQIVFCYSHTADMMELDRVYVHYLARPDAHRTRDIYADSAEWTGHMWLLHGVTIETFSPDGHLLLAQMTRRALLPIDLPFIEPGRVPSEALLPDEMNLLELGRRLQTVEASRRRQYQLAWHQKLAIPCSCLVFGLFALPLALRAPTGSAAGSVALTLTLLFGYYLLATAAALLCVSALLPAALAAWLPDLLLALAGLHLYVRVGASR